MKPKDLLKSRLQEFLVPTLEEKGFRFLRSKICFKRGVEGFEQEIAFMPSGYNREDDCGFQVGWSVHAPEYLRWYEEVWGERPPYDVICGGAEWAIEGWPRVLNGPVGSTTKTRPKWFTLRNDDSDRSEMIELRDAVAGPLLVHLDRVTSWEGAAKFRAGDPALIGFAADLYMIAGNSFMASKVIRDALKDPTVLNNHDSARIIEDLKQRLHRYERDFP